MMTKLPITYAKLGIKRKPITSLINLTQYVHYLIHDDQCRNLTPDVLLKILHTSRLRQGQDYRYSNDHQDWILNISATQAILAIHATTCTETKEATACWTVFNTLTDFLTEDKK